MDQPLRKDYSNEQWSAVALDDVEFLRQLPIFSQLSDHDLGEVRAQFKTATFAPDDVMIEQGLVNGHVFLIKSGIVRIQRLTAQASQPQTVNFLKQGDMMGELNVLRPGSTASATAVARTVVEALLIPAHEFETLLLSHPAVAVEMTRFISNRLIATERRMTRGSNHRVSLIIGVGEVDLTGVGSTLALSFQRSAQREAVYAELPDPAGWGQRMGLSLTAPTLAIDGQYNVYVNAIDAALPHSLQATLALEDLNMRFDRVVVGVPHTYLDVIAALASQVDQIVLLCSDEDGIQAALATVNQHLRNQINPETVGLFTAGQGQSRASQQSILPSLNAEFDLPLPTQEERHRLPTAATLNPAYEAMTSTLADRLGRTNQISLFIPTTIDVDQAVDTSLYVDRALAFLGRCFGGATTTQARGVWNSQQAGLVGESIHIVRSYATQVDLDKSLQSILDFVGQLKIEMRQEAMAVEINQKLMLI